MSASPRRDAGLGWRCALRLTPAIAAVALLHPGACGQQDPPRALVPETVALDDAARQAIDAAWLTEPERAALRVFHGVWNADDLGSPPLRAEVALNAWRFDDPALRDPSVKAELRAEAKLLAGALHEACALLSGVESFRAARIRARAFEGLGDYEAARRAIEPVAARLRRERVDEAGELTEAVQALAIGARIEGRPARDYRNIMALLARAHQGIDRLYWPAKLAEAELLLEKHNTPQAIAALHEALALNPRCARAWYELGRIALGRVDFPSVRAAMSALRRLQPGHPLAELLHAEMRLMRNDPEEARYVLRRLMDRLPQLRQAHALHTAACALLYDPALAEAALARHDELSPGGAEACYTAGRYLSLFRQYDQAAAMLAEAIRRQPKWPAPQIELGLMEMQTGRDDEAMRLLRAAVALDPFDKRAANSLFLVEELAGYDEIETEHFIIRYKPGVDAVLAALMPQPLEESHEAVVSRFGFRPSRKTIIEIMPDHERFAVRVTGMPHVHTIAACTGPIIALEAPREGKKSKHHGTFDWVRVVRHEYTHTVTLEQTKNRIPRWLTEAAAVSMELAPRAYGDCVMLARSYHDGMLFDLEELEWAFKRPKRPGDAHRAYEQAHWMIEFMFERYGREAVIAVLEGFFAGRRGADAIAAGLGADAHVFLEAFRHWAGEQVEAWGLAPQPSMTELTDELRMADDDLALVMYASRKARLDAIVREMARRIGRPAEPRSGPFTADDWPPLLRPPVEISDAQLAAWREAYPDHPDLLRTEIERRLEAADEPESALIPLLERYIELRPVDTFPHRILAQIHLDGETPARAIPHLEELDIREERSPVYALRLAKLYRDRGQSARALAKITRAVQIDAYHPAGRELAAAIAIEAGRLDLARLHIEALTILEPQNPRHRERLRRVDELLTQRRR